jgi:vancomycin resistance protein YoaR
MRDSATFPTATHEAANETVFWTWPRILLAAVLVLVVTSLGTAVGVYVSWKNSGQIAPGMFVQGESLGGLTRAQARERLEKRFGRMFVNVQTPDRDYKLSLSQLGGEILFSDAVNNAYWYGRNGNIASGTIRYWTSQKKEQRRALPVKWDKEQLRKTMWVVATQYQRPARDAKLSVTSAGVQIEPDQTGRALNVGETCATLQKQYYVGKPEIKAATKSVAPKLVAADLVGRDVKLGEYTTSFNPGEYGRTTNVRLAAEAINGKVLMPNEKFSFNAMTGERTMDKGYRVAHIFVRLPGKEKSEIVDGRGGGVCQVSSTLYNAVRKTNNKTDDRLAIIERNNHSLPVSYVPSGLDATVAWPHKDFRFRNTFPHPVYLRAQVSGSRLKISVWGRVPEDTSSITASTDGATATETFADSPT